MQVSVFISTSWVLSKQIFIKLVGNREVSQALSEDISG
jgi:hypothetical protein